MIHRDSTSAQPKVALVYDRVNTTYGGAEQVLLALHQAFPDAPLYTALADRRATRWASVFTIQTSWLQHIPLASYMHRMLAALMPLAFESFDLSEFDIVISVASAECKGVLTFPHQLHVCYLLSPPRYLYHQRQELLDAVWWSKLPLIKELSEWALNYLTWWDSAAMSRPDKVYPLSMVVATRFAKIYQKKPDGIVYPPITTTVETSKSFISHPQITQFTTRNPQFALMVARLVPYKRVDLAIKACLQANQPLVVVGNGPERKKLHKLAHTNYLHLESVDETTLNWLYDHCRMVLVPGQEDFGLTALEANAHGKPVIVHKAAGAAELITDEVHGFHLVDQKISSLTKLIKRMQTSHFTPQSLRQNAQKYDTSKFVRQFRQLVLADWQQHTSMVFK